MTLPEQLKAPELTLSFEVFPPKTDTSLENVRAATEKIAGLKPSFISVTYGAGGAGSRFTLEIAESLRETTGVEILVHVTSVGSNPDTLRTFLTKMRQHGLRNVMALRGDLPADRKEPEAYPHAADLIRAIRAEGSFCIGAACYPEVHPESRNQADDIRSLREKQESGADFLTTQMFFDNNLLYNFLYKLREAGVTLPVVPGIMPITSANQVKRALELSGCFMPRRFISLVDKFGSDAAAMTQAGIAYATDQIIDLYANGIRHVHVYTMNKPEVAAAIRNNLKELLGKRF